MLIYDGICFLIGFGAILLLAFSFNVAVFGAVVVIIFHMLLFFCNICDNRGLELPSKYRTLHHLGLSYIVILLVNGYIQTGQNDVFHSGVCICY